MTTKQAHLADRPEPSRAGTGVVTRVALVVLEAVVALNAFAGGYYGMSGAPTVPVEWLDGTPFEDYVVPGVILFVAVGGTMSAAALAGAFAGRRRASLAGRGAALVLLGWIVVQVAMIGYVSFLQPLFFALALAIFVLAWQLPREAVEQELVGAPAVEAIGDPHTSERCKPVER